MVTGGDVVVSEAESKRLPAEAILRNGKIILLKSTNGVCSLLKNKSCSCFNSRPQGCREYPWYKINGQLFYDKGCPGMRFDRDERPNVREISPIERYFPVNHVMAIFLIFLFRSW
jgi:Fe-S-cluster containining protein